MDIQHFKIFPRLDQDSDPQHCLLVLTAGTVLPYLNLKFYYIGHVFSFCAFSFGQNFFSRLGAVADRPLFPLFTCSFSFIIETDWYVCRVFVGGISSSTTESELHQLFSGNITRLISYSQQQLFEHS